RELVAASQPGPTPHAGSVRAMSPTPRPHGQGPGRSRVRRILRRPVEEVLFFLTIRGVFESLPLHSTQPLTNPGRVAPGCSLSPVAAAQNSSNSSAFPPHQLLAPRRFSGEGVSVYT